MKAKMSYKSKKIAIITAIIVLLIAAISTGTYFFIKGNDNAEATYAGNSQGIEGANNGESETAGNGEEQTNPAEDQNNVNGEENQGGENSQEPTDVDENTDNNTDETTPGTTTGGGTDTTTDNDGNDSNTPDGEYTQIDIIEREVERIDQEVRVGWSNMALEGANMSTDITTTRPNLTTNKTATVLNSLNENNNAVQEGSKIRYEITITNNSQDVDAKGVNVSDAIPAGTVLDEESEISNGGTEVNGRVSWVIDVARNSSVTVSFTVVVKSTDGEINNVAVVDGKDTPEATNPVIETNKESSSKDKVLEAGSEVTYTISVKNTGDATATTTVKDTVPAGTTLVEGSIEGAEDYTVEDVNGQKVITWNNVEVAKDATVELKFTVTINKFKGESIEIKNTAVVGDKETNTDTETAYNPIFSVEKVANPSKVVEGDTITYTITAENTGKVDGLATIKDNVPEGTTFVNGSIKINGESSYTLNGEKIDLTTKTANDLANGIQVNVEKNNGTVKLSFEVTVNENSGLTNKISNVAYLVDENGNEKPTDPTETDVDAHIVFIENGGSEVKDINGVAGEKIDDTNMPTTTRPGYTLDGWYAEKALTNKVEQLPENMVAGTTYYYAKWTANNDTAYKVEHYLENLDGKGYTLKETENLTGTTDEKVTATPKTYEGFTFDSSVEGTVQEGIVAGDGGLVLKLYYTRNSYKVTYNPGKHGTFATEEYTAGYGDTTPAFEGETTGENGFYFVDWDADIATIVTENATYTALWEGLKVSKTRTGIVDLDKQDNSTFVDQAGDIIKYTITVKNVGDVNASGIKLTDNHDVTVTSIKVNGNEIDISGMDKISAGEDLLKNVTTELEPNSSVVVTVEYTVTKADLEEALNGDGKIVNTATATLNNHNYTDSDKTDGEEGTDVKERCEYTVLYYFNGELNDKYTVESSTVEGATIAFEKPDTLDGYTYVKYVGVDGEDNGSTTAVEGENIIKVYYAKPVVSIEKTSTANVNAGDDIEYTITVSNDGDLGTTVTVEDELKGTTYVSGSSKVGDKATEPTIENKVLSWEVELAADETKTITFKATTANDSIGDTIENTASIEGEDKNDTTTTDVNEIDVNYNEFKEGQKGTDLNIIFVLDNSSSMNYPIEGQSYRYNDNPIAPTDEYKTRIYNAKEAIKGFIDNQSNNPNTDMSVITFNQDSTGTTDTKGGMFSDAMRTLLDPNEYDIKEESYGLFGKRYYTIIDGERYDLERVTGSDGKQYYAANLPIKYGARLAGTNAESNEALKTIVDNISISSEKSGFGTYIGYAFNLINNNREQYLSATKKNIIIVLADGDFNGSYSNALKDLKEQNRFSDYNVDEIYSIGFGADYNEAKLKEVSTNNKCYSASNSSDLLEQFNNILEEATGTEQTDTTVNGKVTFKQATGDIKVSADCPIEATYATGEFDGEGNEIMATLFSCTSEADLSKYGLSISRGYITWDAKVFARNSPDVKVPSEVNIKYYIARD